MLPLTENFASRNCRRVTVTFHINLNLPLLKEKATCRSRMNSKLSDFWRRGQGSLLCEKVMLALGSSLP